MEAAVHNNARTLAALPLIHVACLGILGDEVNQTIDITKQLPCLALQLALMPCCTNSIFWSTVTDMSAILTFEQFDRNDLVGLTFNICLHYKAVLAFAHHLDWGEVLATHRYSQW